MIVSASVPRSNSRWLQMCVLLCAVVVLPLGIASAQDYEAVGRRLRAAVAAGELTGEQARAMLEALRETGAKKDKGADRVKAYLGKAKKDLDAAVEAGKISREDAAKKYEAAAKGVRERMAAGRRQRGDERRPITREDYARAEAQLKKAVGEGKISAEDARARLQGMRKMMAGQSERAGKIDLDAIKGRIEKAVASGRMTREAADKMMEGYKKRMAKAKRGGDEDQGYRAAVSRIRAAVAEGKMTREEAGAKIKGYRERIGRGRQAEDPDKKLDYDAIGRRIRAAVAAGKMTEEEAKAKWAEIRDKAAAKEGD